MGTEMAVTNLTTPQPITAPTTRAPITVAVVNDFDIIVRGVAAMLEPWPHLSVVELDVGGCPDRPVDVALFDTFATPRNCLDRAADMIEDATVRSVVMYTWQASQDFLDHAYDIGVADVVYKSEPAETLVGAIHRVADGHRSARRRPQRARSVAGTDQLTEREREVLALLAAGHPNRRIADELFLSPDTVKTHLRSLYRKLGVQNRTQAAVRADVWIGTPVGIATA